MSHKHLITASSISKSELIAYIDTATHMRDWVKNGTQLPPQYPSKTLITMFYEPSTRTNCSFQAAAIKLGCKVISLTEKASSSEKGESLEDTIQTLQYYGDAIVLRHPAKGSSERAAEVSTVPIINGGDGNGEHPTQALLDVFTIYSEMLEKGIDLYQSDREVINITFVGDLKNSRTIHSLIRLLLHFPRLRFVYVSPFPLEMPIEIVNMISHHPNGYEQHKSASLEDVILNADVLYMTRIQRERFETEDAYKSVLKDSELYWLTPELMADAKDEMIVMHPLPRLEEIPPELDSDERTVYFKQVENGLYMRMAILDSLFRE